MATLLIIKVTVVTVTIPTTVDIDIVTNRLQSVVGYNTVVSSSPTTVSIGSAASTANQFTEDQMFTT